MENKRYNTQQFDKENDKFRRNDRGPNSYPSSITSPKFRYEDENPNNYGGIKSSNKNFQNIPTKINKENIVSQLTPID